jgi:hypothetical protein
MCVAQKSDSRARSDENDGSGAGSPIAGCNTDHQLKPLPDIVPSYQPHDTLSIKCRVILKHQCTLAGFLQDSFWVFGVGGMGAFGL